MKAVKIFLKNLIFAFRYQRIWLKIVSFDTRGLLCNLLLLLVLGAVYELEQVQEKLLQAVTVIR